VVDTILLAIFGTSALAGFFGTVFCVRKALRVSREREGDIKMFLWAAASMMCMIVSGMSAGYILLPILLRN
jgi:hypothetical protein